MRMFKRITAAALSLAICPLAMPVDYSNVPFTVVAAEATASGTCGETAYWELTDGTLRIYGTGETSAVTWHEYASDIQNVVVEDGITLIGDGAFSGCRKLETVTLPDTLLGIMSNAFKGCVSLYKINIPDSVTTIASGLFDDTLLIEIEDGIKYVGNWAVGCETVLDDVYIRNGTTGVSAYFYEGDTKSVTFPKSLKNITYLAFAGFNELGEINYRGSEEEWNKINNADSYLMEQIVSKINFLNEEDEVSNKCGETATWTYADGIITIDGSGDMYDYSSEKPAPWYDMRNDIKGIVISEDITKVGAYAFFANEYVESITISDGVKELGEAAFFGCNGVESIYVPESVSVIGLGAFNIGYKFKSLTIENPKCEIHDSRITIPDFATIHGYENSTAQAYAEKYNRTFEIIGGSPSEDVTSGECGENATWSFDKESGTLTIDGSGDMYDYTSNEPAPWNEFKSETEKIVISSGIKKIGAYAFLGYSADLVISSGVEKIGESAFYANMKVASLALPDTVKEIDKNAFYGCLSLETVYLPESVSTIGSGAFGGGIDLKSVTIENPECEIYDIEIAITKSAIIYGHENSTAQAYAEKYNHTFRLIGEEPTTTTTAATTETTTTTTTTTKPSEDVKSGTCGENAKWTLSDGVLTISGSGEMADYTIKEPAPWYDMKAEIINVVIEEGITRAGSNLFSDSNNISLIVIPSTMKSIGNGAFQFADIEEIAIPFGVEVIEEDAFFGCSLKSLTLPNSVKEIGESAFGGCDGLETVYIPKSVTLIDFDAFHLSDNIKSVTIAGKDCEIYDDEDTFPPLATIYGYENSTAQAYAEKYNRTFRLIGEEPTTTTTTATTETTTTTTTTTKPSEEVKSGTCGENATWTYANGVLTIGGSGDIYDYSDNSPAPWNSFRYEINKIVIPGTIKRIGSSAFDCTDASIEIGLGVETIGDHAFFSNDYIKSLTLPDSIKEIEKSAFCGCSVLETVYIPESIESVGFLAFYLCDNLKSITVANPDCDIYKSDGTFPEEATIYGKEGSTAQAYAEKYNRTFSLIGEEPTTTTTATTTASTTESATTTTTEPSESIVSGTCGESATWSFDKESGVLTIGGSGDMQDYKNDSDVPWVEYKYDIKKIVISGDIKKIGSYAFMSIDADVVISAGVEVIGQDSFFSSDKITSLILPDTVKEIESSAFFGCDVLETIYLPESVSSIGFDAFGGCEKLKSITIENPDCEIVDWNSTIYKSATIYGKEGSTAQAYAEKYGRTFKVIGASAFRFGDVDSNGLVDATDASLILAEYAIRATGGDSEFSSDQSKAADINGDELIDANDASIILAYYTYLSTGGTESDIMKWYEAEEK